MFLDVLVDDVVQLGPCFDIAWRKRDRPLGIVASLGSNLIGSVYVDKGVVDGYMMLGVTCCRRCSFLLAGATRSTSGAPQTEGSFCLP